MSPVFEALKDNEVEIIENIAVQAVANATKEKEPLFCVSINDSDLACNLYVNESKVQNDKETNVTCEQEILSSVCPECMASYRNGFLAHLREESRLISCQICNIILNSRCAMKIHDRLHNFKSPLMCPECGKIFSNNNSLEQITQHLLEQCCHFFKSYVLNCRVCLKIYRHQYSFEKHLRSHIENVFKCTKCFFHSLFYKVIRDHSTTHEPPSEWKRRRACGFCKIVNVGDGLSHVSHHLLNAKWISAYICHCGFHAFNKISFKDHADKCKQSKIPPKWWTDVSGYKCDGVSQIDTEESQEIRLCEACCSNNLQSNQDGSCLRCARAFSFSVAGEEILETDVEENEESNFSLLKLEYPKIPDDHNSYCKAYESKHCVIGVMQEQLCQLMSPSFVVKDQCANLLIKKARLLSALHSNQNNVIDKNANTTLKLEACHLGSQKSELVFTKRRTCPFCNCKMSSLKSFASHLKFKHSSSYLPIHPKLPVPSAKDLMSCTILNVDSTAELNTCRVNYGEVNSDVTNDECFSYLGSVGESDSDLKSSNERNSTEKETEVEDSSLLTSAIDSSKCVVNGLRRSKRTSVNEATLSSTKTDLSGASSGNCTALQDKCKIKNRKSVQEVFKKDYEFWDTFYNKLALVERGQGRKEDDGEAESKDSSEIELMESFSKRTVKKPRRLLEEEHGIIPKKPKHSETLASKPRLRSQSNIASSKNISTGVINSNSHLKPAEDISVTSKNPGKDDTNELSVGEESECKKEIVQRNEISATEVNNEDKKTSPKLSGQAKTNRKSRKSATKTGIPSESERDLYYGKLLNKEDVDKNKMCSVCNVNFDNSDDFKKHVVTHRTADSNYQCMECGDEFVVYPSFVRHLRGIHKILDVEKYIADNDGSGAIVKSDNLPIDHNGRTEGTPDDEDDRPLKSPAKENQCKVCMDVFESNSDLKKHFRKHGMAFLQEAKTER